MNYDKDYQPHQHEILTSRSMVSIGPNDLIIGLTLEVSNVVSIACYMYNVDCVKVVCRLHQL